jgi:hypothetical protein
MLVICDNDTRHVSATLCVSDVTLSRGDSGVVMSIRLGTTTLSSSLPSPTSSFIQLIGRGPLPSPAFPSPENSVSSPGRILDLARTAKSSRLRPHFSYRRRQLVLSIYRLQKKENINLHIHPSCLSVLQPLATPSSRPSRPPPRPPGLRSQRGPSPFSPTRLPGPPSPAMPPGLLVCVDPIFRLRLLFFLVSWQKRMVHGS